MKFEEFKKLKYIAESEDRAMLNNFPDAQRLYTWMEETGRIDEGLWAVIWSWLKRNFSIRARRLHHLADQYGDALYQEAKAEFGKAKDRKDIASLMRVAKYSGRISDDYHERMRVLAGDDPDYQDLVRLLVNKQNLKVKRSFVHEYSDILPEEERDKMKSALNKEDEENEEELERQYASMTGPQKSNLREIEDALSRKIKSNQNFIDEFIKSADAEHRFIKMIVVYTKIMSEKKREVKFNEKAAVEYFDKILELLKDVSNKIEDSMNVSYNKAIENVYYSLADMITTMAEPGKTIYDIENLHRRIFDKTKERIEIIDRVEDEISTDYTDQVVSSDQVEDYISKVQSSQKQPSYLSTLEKIDKIVKKELEKGRDSWLRDVNDKIKEFNSLDKDQRKTVASEFNYNVDADFNIKLATKEDIDNIYDAITNFLGVIVNALAVDDEESEDKKIDTAITWMTTVMFEIYAVQKDPDGHINVQEKRLILANLRKEDLIQTETARKHAKKLGKKMPKRAFQDNPLVQELENDDEYMKNKVKISQEEDDEKQNDNTIDGKDLTTISIEDLESMVQQAKEDGKTATFNILNAWLDDKKRMLKVSNADDNEIDIPIQEPEDIEEENPIEIMEKDIYYQVAKHVVENQAVSTPSVFKFIQENYPDYAKSMTKTKLNNKIKEIIKKLEDDKIISPVDKSKPIGNQREYFIKTVDELNTIIKREDKKDDSHETTDTPEIEDSSIDDKEKNDQNKKDLDDKTILAFCTSSDILHKLDTEICKVTNSILKTSIDINGDVNRLSFVGIYNESDLKKAIKDNYNDIVEFAKSFIGENSNKVFERGIGLFYLEYLLVAKMGEEKVREYLKAYISEKPNSIDIQTDAILYTYKRIEGEKAPTPTPEENDAKEDIDSPEDVKAGDETVHVDSTDDNNEEDELSKDIPENDSVEKIHKELDEYIENNLSGDSETVIENTKELAKEDTVTFVTKEIKHLLHWIAVLEDDNEVDTVEYLQLKLKYMKVMLLRCKKKGLKAQSFTEKAKSKARKIVKKFQKRSKDLKKGFKEKLLNFFSEEEDTHFDDIPRNRQKNESIQVLSFDTWLNENEEWSDIQFKKSQSNIKTKIEDEFSSSDLILIDETSDQFKKIDQMTTTDIGTILIEDYNDKITLYTSPFEFAKWEQLGANGEVIETLFIIDKENVSKI